MKKNGFSVVKPSLLEFENSLFFLHKDQNDPNSFRVMDPISQKMMGIRSDITPQIARGIMWFSLKFTKTITLMLLRRGFQS